MTIYSSLLNKSFFDDSFHDSLPEDCIEISRDDHQALMAGQGQGKIISWRDDGSVYLEEPEELTQDQIKNNAELKYSALLREAADRMGPLLDLESLGEISDEEKLKLLDWRKYRIALSRVSSQEKYPVQIDWPEHPKDENETN